MCSWCFGYRPVWQKIEQSLADRITTKYILGGLAPDTDEAMPSEMKSYIQQTWRRISEQLGTEFNFEFWNKCNPRRDTYKACRAVLAARWQDKEKEMIHEIQDAYYLKAINPSDYDNLQNISRSLLLDEQRFTDDIMSAALDAELMEEIQFARSLPIQGFPSLVLKVDDSLFPIQVNYHDDVETTNQILEVVNHSSNMCK